MTDWRTYTIGETGVILTGRTPAASAPEAFNGEYPFITPTDMNGRRFMSSTERTLSVIGSTMLKSLALPSMSICVSCIGWQLGKVVLTDKKSFTNQQINSIIPNEDFDALFLYYLLKTKRDLLFNLGSMGVRTPIVNKSTFSSIEIAVPRLSTQHRIASILSNYDNLIENNTRRIEILEEMSRRLYEEWFVRFRFPGNEDVAFRDSNHGRTPEGWQEHPFSELAEFINGYAFKTSDWEKEGTPIVKIRELKQGVTSDTPRFLGTLAEKYEVRDGDILFSWSADIDAYIWQGGDAWLNQHLFKVIPTGETNSLFIYFALKHKMDNFRARAAGTTMRHIKRSALNEVTTLHPPYAMIAQFERTVGPMVQLGLSLKKKNTNLRAQRDLLLPKLISGQIDVSQAEEIAEEAAA